MGTETPNLKEMKTRLDDLATKITNLEAKVRKGKPQVEAHIEQVETLRAKQRTAREKLEQLEKATHDEMKNLKSGWEEIINDMQQVLDKVASSY